MKEDSLANKAYSELRRKILSNQLVLGMRLKEDVWANKLDVNRMAIREALTRLLGEQLVVKGERGGFFVKSLTAADIQEIRELREILELGALRLAIQKIDIHHINELERICDDFTSMIQRGYFGGACEADVKFHETLIDSAGNEKLRNLYQSGNIPLFHQKLGRTQTHMDDYELTDMEHRQILKALKEKDGKLAEDTLIKHLIRGEVGSLDLE
jgi:DNA-binding GntR family transcriptional regulator